MRRKHIATNQQGFTIVELMIATVIFSMVLLICGYAIIHVGRMYYKGMITNRTQDVARKVIDDVVSTIQFGTGDPSAFVRHVTDGSREAYCFGGVRYTFDRTLSLGNAGNQLRHVLWKDRVGTGECVPVDLTLATPSNTGVEMLGENMRLPEFTVSSTDHIVWSVRIRVSYGDSPELFEDANYQVCKGTNAGGQFCAVSEFNTTTTRRVL